MSLKQEKQDFMHRMHMMMIKVLFIFGIPAGIAFFIGQWLDARFFDGSRKGSLLALMVSFVLSWLITLRMYSQIEKERLSLDAREAEEREQKQAEIKEKLQNMSSKEE